jgi:hypothetical protein
MPIPKKPKITGPATYFPSIEKKYGKPVRYWFQIIERLGRMKHMELVERLKKEHGIGHGHANALVGYVLHRADGK